MITQAEMPLERMQRAVKGGCTCSECGALLTLAYGGKWGILQDVLMCPGNPEHKGMAREAALSVMDTPNEYNPYSYLLARKRRSKLVTKYGDETGRKLAPYSGRTNLVPAEAREIIMTMFPGAPELEVKKAVWICVQKRLTPLLGHLFLVGYKNKEGGKDWAILLSIKVNRIRAMRAGGISYLDNTPRLMTEAEQIRIRGYVDKVNDWYICKGRNSRGQEASGYGCWPKNLAPKGTDKGNTGSNMGMIRAERQMIDRLCPDDDIDSDIGVTDGRYASIGSHIIDMGTGEIVEGERAEIIPELPKAEVTPPDSGDTPPENGGPAKNLPSPEIKTLGDLFTKANKELHLSQSQVLAKLGIASKDLIGDLSEAWQKLTGQTA